MPRHYNGAPIFHFICKDVKTGEDVTLGACYFAEEVSKTIGGHYYEDIVEATNDFDILWSLSDERISPVADTFDAMTSRRSYRDALDLQYVKDEIKKCEKRLLREKVKSHTFNFILKYNYSSKHPITN